MKKIYVLGDSISIHYGPYLQRYLTGIIEYSRKEGEQEALLNLDTPQGANGGDSVKVLAFLKAMRDSGGINADYILINCGLHDLRIMTDTGKQNIPVDEYSDNLQKIIKTAVMMDLKPVWIQTTPIDDKIHNDSPAVKEMGFQRHLSDCTAYNFASKKVMNKESIPIIDLYTFTINLGTDLYCDHAHFNEDIREKQAAFISGWLSAFLIK